MIKMLLGAAIVVVLVGFGVFSTSDIEKAGNAAVSFVKDDIRVEKIILPIGDGITICKKV